MAVEMEEEFAVLRQLAKELAIVRVATQRCKKMLKEAGL